MRERAWELLVYGPILMSLVLIGGGMLILLGPVMGGQLGVLHAAMRDAFAGDDRAVADAVQPAVVVAAQGSVPLSHVGSDRDTSAVPSFVLPAESMRPLDASCAALRFAAALGIERGYVSFGRFNVVSDTDPYGRRDPLTTWKLLQFGGFPIRTEMIEGEESTSVPVNQTVNLLISDPYSQEMLFSAKWQIEAIEMHGRYASINADLAPNLSGVGVNNAIDSPTLARFARDGRGVLVMGFAHSGAIAPALKVGDPVYAEVTGTMYPAYCVR